MGVEGPIRSNITFDVTKRTKVVVIRHVYWVQYTTNALAVTAVHQSFRLLAGFGELLCSGILKQWGMVKGRRRDSVWRLLTSSAFEPWLCHC